MLVHGNNQTSVICDYDFRLLFKRRISRYFSCSHISDMRSLVNFHDNFKNISRLFVNYAKYIAINRYQDSFKDTQQLDFSNGRKR